MPKIAIIPGSARVPGNCKGIVAWVTQLMSDRLGGQDGNPPEIYFTIMALDVTSPPYPLGPLVDGTLMPAQIRDSAKYRSPAIQEWSTFISSCDGFVIVTPQHNWGIPGELKSSLDHLYWEWRDKPVMFVTYGGHGGSRCAAQLKDVLGGGLKMHVLSRSVQITLPSDYITGDQRVPEDGPIPDFLQGYAPSVLDAIDELKQSLTDKSTSPDA